jgi:hypothetical protein
VRTLTRQELFEAAWDRPLTKVAAELGVTSTALRKTCDRHLIPVPRRGYWAAVASGKVFRRPKLKPVKDGRLEQILIRGATPAMTAAMAIRKARKAPPAEDTPQDPPLEEAAAPAPQREVLHVVVPTRLRSAHRLVAAWIDDDRRMRESWGRLGGREVSEQEVFVNGRRQLLLDALFKVLEQRGHKVEADRRLSYQGQLRIGHQSLDFTLLPRITYRREPLTAAEMADPTYGNGRRRYRQVREENGELELVVKDALGTKGVWHDDGEQLLELRLGEVVLGIEDLGRAAAATQARRSEEERVRREAEHRRAELENQRRRDANQWRRLRELSERDEEVQQVRRFMVTVRARAEAEGGLDEEMLAWLSWADAWIAAWDPLANGAGPLMQRVKQVGERDYRD